MAKRIKVEISADGNVKAETLGIFGQKCLDYVAILEDMLEAEAIQSSFNGDYTKSEDAITDQQGVKNES